MKTISVRIPDGLRLDTYTGQRRALIHYPYRKLAELLQSGYGARFHREKTVKGQRYAVFELVFVGKGKGREGGDEPTVHKRLSQRSATDNRND